jgi:hypothetical protein
MTDIMNYTADRQQGQELDYYKVRNSSNMDQPSNCNQYFRKLGSEMW